MAARDRKTISGVRERRNKISFSAMGMTGDELCGVKFHINSGARTPHFSFNAVFQRLADKISISRGARIKF